MTKLDPVKPLVRQAVTPSATYVLTLTARTVTLRPLRARDVSASVTVSWDTIYERALRARVRDT